MTPTPHPSPWLKPLIFLKILAFSTFAAVAFGIPFDLVSIHLYPEYFTVHHPVIVDSDNLVVIALAWGVAATWWFGAIGGVILGTSAVVGPFPAADFLRIAKTVALTLLAFYPLSWIVRATVFFTTRPNTEDATASFQANLAMHNFAYLGMAAAILVIAVMTYFKRPNV